MVLVRLCKVALVAAIALFFSLVAFGNITDYGSNWLFVQHVLSMDTTFADSDLHWRAIVNPHLQQAGYLSIIAVETVTALLLWVGAFRLLGVVRSDEFGRKKSLAVAGLTLGILLYAVGFISIGGEWFAMWQSQIWNGEQKAFDFVAMIGVVMVILLLPEGEPVRGRREA
jgi:predicted small integral membrane protein